MDELKKAQAARHGMPVEMKALEREVTTPATPSRGVSALQPLQPLQPDDALSRNNLPRDHHADRLPGGMAAVGAGSLQRGLLIGGLIVAGLALALYLQQATAPAALGQGTAHEVVALTDLQQAEAAWQRGDMAAARRAYQQHLTAHPADAAALQGLARLVMQEVAGGGARQAAIAELQDLQQRQPQLGRLYYALGHVYAADAQWSLARAEFQHALALEPLEPDYLYNLAVSLDQLQQPQPALQFYRLAQAAARERSASFDQAQLKARLAALQSR